MADAYSAMVFDRSSIEDGWYAFYNVLWSTGHRYYRNVLLLLYPVAHYIRFEMLSNLWDENEFSLFQLICYSFILVCVSV